ncbi:MAG: hypothetical protein H6577_27680 [Lewinellaceae bacterium]|nr:hypothetical protein [Saprospiraceae bacterium]MCB9341926.1 hypothetical protein [Lewinellaceae bacterium]
MFSHLYHLLYHLDGTLLQVIHPFGRLTYLLLSTLVFCETGLVVTPFLPGDGRRVGCGAAQSGGSTGGTFFCGLPGQPHQLLQQ